MSAGGEDAGVGHRLLLLVFTNTSKGACTMHGYPAVAALNAAGAQVAQATRTLAGYMGGLASGQPPTVTLAPGQSASAIVEALGFNADGSACTGHTAYQWLLVTAPDDTASTRVSSWGNNGCSDLEIHPVVPGTTGSAR